MSSLVRSLIETMSRLRKLAMRFTGDSRPESIKSPRRIDPTTCLPLFKWSVFRTKLSTAASQESILAKEARTFRAIFDRNIKMFVSYKTSVIATIVWPVPILALNIYQYLGLASQDQVESILQAPQYGVSSLHGMVIVGTIVYLLYNKLLWGTGASLQSERWMGTIEALLLTPANRLVILFSFGFVSLIEGSWWIAGVFVLSWGIFGISPQASSWGAVALAFTSTMIALIAVGVFFASFFILTRAADQFATGLQAPIRYFSGVAFPVNAIGVQALQAVAYIFPITYGIQSLRRTLLSNGSLESILPDVGLLYVFTVILVALAYVLLKKVERRAKRDGSLYKI